tara:strand:- start:262 stop:780 length:519 start_codon:yes stop_codon:yes gene_type:complete
MGQPKGKELTVEQVAYIKALQDTLGRIPQVEGYNDREARHDIGVLARHPHREDLAQRQDVITKKAEDAITYHVKWTQSLQIMKALAMASLKPTEDPGYPTVGALIAHLSLFPPNMRVMTPGFDEMGLLDINIDEIALNMVREAMPSPHATHEIDKLRVPTNTPKTLAVIINH